MTKTILTVDDSPSIRQMVAATLRFGGYTVVEAVDGVDALALAGQHEDVALVLTDQNMPNMDGLTLTRNLRSQSQYARTPILMLTTESSAEMKAAGKAAGLTGWMVKPFDPKTLLNVIAKVLD
jgi:two-component system chemotaxis response regulator CheY